MSQSHLLFPLSLSLKIAPIGNILMGKEHEWKKSSFQTCCAIFLWERLLNRLERRKMKKERKKNLFLIPMKWTIGGYNIIVSQGYQLNREWIRSFHVNQSLSTIDTIRSFIPPVNTSSLQSQLVLFSLFFSFLLLPFFFQIFIYSFFFVSGIFVDK